MGHEAARASQQGQPVTAAEPRTVLDREIVRAQDNVRDLQHKPAPDWTVHSQLANLLVARARLTGDFDDYVAAGAAFDAAFRSAPQGSGPHLDRVAYNFAIHRLDDMAPDIAAIDRYALPDDAVTAAARGYRGDIAFFTGRYDEARADYEGAQAVTPTFANTLKLANWHAMLGDPRRAAALLDEADAMVTGPQQQLRAYVEMRRGVLDMQRGRWRDAERHFRRADDIFPGYRVIEEKLATVCLALGKPEEALALFRRMAARDGTPEAYDGLAGVLRARGEIAEANVNAARADVLWRERLKLLPEAAFGHAVDHWLAFGDPAEALSAAQRNFKARPFGDTATALAAAYLATTDPKTRWTCWLRR